MDGFGQPLFDLDGARRERKEAAIAPKAGFAFGATDQLVTARLALAAQGYDVTEVSEPADLERIAERMWPGAVVLVVQASPASRAGITVADVASSLQNQDLARPPILVGDIEIDPDQRTVTRSAQPISTTRTEYSVLELLMRNVDIVLPRSVMYERIWGIDLHESSKSLDVHIGALRRKLEAHGERVIHNVRGVGYVMWSATGR